MGSMAVLPRSTGSRIWAAGRTAADTSSRRRRSFRRRPARRGSPRPSSSLPLVSCMPSSQRQRAKASQRVHALQNHIENACAKIGDSTKTLIVTNSEVVRKSRHCRLQVGKFQSGNTRERKKVTDAMNKRYARLQAGFDDLRLELRCMPPSHPSRRRLRYFCVHVSTSNSVDTLPLRVLPQYGPVGWIQNSYQVQRLSSKR